MKKQESFVFEWMLYVQCLFPFTNWKKTCLIRFNSTRRNSRESNDLSLEKAFCWEINKKIDQSNVHYNYALRQFCASSFVKIQVLCLMQIWRISLQENQMPFLHQTRRKDVFPKFVVFFFNFPHIENHEM